MTFPGERPRGYYVESSPQRVLSPDTFPEEARGPSVKTACHNSTCQIRRWTFNVEPETPRSQSPRVYSAGERLSGPRSKVSIIWLGLESPPRVTKPTYHADSFSWLIVQRPLRMTRPTCDFPTCLFLAGVARVFSAGHKQHSLWLNVKEKQQRARFLLC